MIPEGTLKYHAHRTDGPVPDHPAFDDLNRCRTELHDMKLVGVYPDGIGYGNVSVRADTGCFLISGTSTGRFRELTRDQYAFVRAFDLDRNTVTSIGRIDASAESMSHGAVYRARPGVNAVIHLHSRRLFDFMRKAGYPETDAAIPFGTPELARAILALVTELNTDEAAFVMAGHDEGVIAYGTSVAAALARVKQLCAQGGLI